MQHIQQVCKLCRIKDQIAVTNVILYGESIISQNCVYMLGLTLEGNLIFQNTITGNILWQTNTSTSNVHPNGTTAENFNFFVAANTIYIMEAFSILSNILWSAQMNMTDTNINLRLIVTNDGYMIFYTTPYSELWRRPLTSNAVSMETTVKYRIRYKYKRKLEAGSENTENTDDLIWYWMILLGLLVGFCICCIVCRAYKKRCNYFTTAPKVTRRMDTFPRGLSSTSNAQDDQVISDWVIGGTSVDPTTEQKRQTELMMPGEIQMKNANVVSNSVSDNFEYTIY